VQNEDDHELRDGVTGCGREAQLKIEQVVGKVAAPKPTSAVIHTGPGGHEPEPGSTRKVMGKTVRDARRDAGPGVHSGT